MKFSVSIKSDAGDTYYVYLAPLDAGIEYDLNLRSYSDVEVYQIVLDRETGTNTTDIHVLNDISDFIAKVFLGNDNLILYYYCDDIQEIPSSNHVILPQEYRNRLFSTMISRYLQQHDSLDIVDTPISIIDAVGNAQYIHFISRLDHLPVVDDIVRFVVEHYGK